MRIEPPVSVPVAIGNQAGGDRRARSAARSAGNPLGIPGIAHRAEMRIGGRDAVGEFVQSGLADQHRARVIQLRGTTAVVIGDEIREDFRARGGADAARHHQILVRDGNAVQRATVDAAREFGIHGGGAGAARHRRGR